MEVCREDAMKSCGRTDSTRGSDTIDATAKDTGARGTAKGTGTIGLVSKKDRVTSATISRVTGVSGIKGRDMEAERAVDGEAEAARERRGIVGALSLRDVANLVIGEKVS
jgi:hypothetical protein